VNTPVEPPADETTALTDLENSVMAVVDAEADRAPMDEKPQDGEVQAALASAPSFETDGMIALIPSAGNRERLTIADGTHPDDLHCTILYLGDITEFPDEALTSVMDDIVGYVEDDPGPVVAEGFNVSLFNPHRDDKDTCVVLGLSGSMLAGAHRKLVERIMRRLEEAGVSIPEQHEPWIPHLTLAYTDDPARVAEFAEHTGDITFDAIRIALGDDVYDIDLTPEYFGEGEEGEIIYDTPEESEEFSVVTTEDEDLSAYNADGGEQMDGEITEGTESVDVSTPGAWHGVLVVEDVESGDGRMFSGGSLKTAPLPLPLMWQRETDEGHKKAVQVGRIDDVWREGNRIWGSGVFDLRGVDGQEAHRQVEGKFLRGVSVDVDSVKDADVEMVFPKTDGDASAEDDMMKLFSPPELTVFHRGRLRGATLVQFPAFVEASISLDGPTGGADPVAVEDTDAVTASSVLEFTAFAPHDTGTSDGEWDAGANEGRLPSPMSVETASHVYAWYDEDAVENDEIVKAALKFPHHEVGEDGRPGAANMKACASAIGALHGARGSEPSIPDDDMESVYNHLAAHMRDAEMEPPEFSMNVSACDHPDGLAACGCTDEEAPDPAFFTDPKLTGPTPLTVDGMRVYGHAALKGTCHTGFSGQCVTMPQEGSHEYFLLGETLCADGSLIATGTITLGTGHAGTDGSVTPMDAIKHYDHTGAAVADVVTGEDEFGLWFSGALRPNLSAAKVRQLRAAKLSGDWRKFGRQLRLVALLAVNVPGFPVPRMKTAMSNGRQTALVAAGINPMNSRTRRKQADQESLKSVVASLAKRIGRDPQTRMSELKSQVHGR
jgi:2'-5' RNA ligase